MDHELKRPPSGGDREERRRHHPPCRRASRWPARHRVSDDGAGSIASASSEGRERDWSSRRRTQRREITNLIFLPGFSTAEKISDISGRGVGMDVVRRNIQDLGGRISLKSVRGRGMTIQLALPLTLAVMDGMVIKVAGNTYVMPMSTIVECMHRRADDSSNLLGTRGVISAARRMVQLVYLTDLFDLPAVAQDSPNSVVIITKPATDALRTCG